MRIPSLKHALVVLSLSCALPYGTASIATEAFPPKMVRLIVPMAGGTTDVLGRLVADKLADALSTTVIVENKAGAGGNIATDYVAKGPADGSVILVGVNAPLVVNNTLFDNLPYDPARDFAPITLAVSTSQYLVVHPSLPVNNVQEFVEYVKAHPGFPYASVGVGGASHLTMEMFRTAAELDMTHVPYRGAGPAVVDLLGGTVKAAFLVPGNVLPHVEAGNLRVLASTGRKRIESTPDVPTLIESGYEDFEAIAWIGFLARTGTPPEVVQRYNRELVSILQLPDVASKLSEMQFEITPSTPEAFSDFMDEEIERWRTVIEVTGVKPEQ